MPPKKITPVLNPGPDATPVAIGNPVGLPDTTTGATTTTTTMTTAARGTPSVTATFASVIQRIVYLCDFPNDSTMVKVIQQ